MSHRIHHHRDCDRGPQCHGGQRNAFANSLIQAGLNLVNQDRNHYGADDRLGESLIRAGSNMLT
jgi:hypothetical protein